MTAIAFIGLGIMGAPMAGHVLAAGHTLHLHSRTRAKAAALIAAGGIWHNHPSDAAAQADVVITIVGLPSDVEQLYLSAGGLLERAKPGAILIDMTTSTPSLAVRIAAEAATRGLSAIDAPVSGGPAGAESASLSIMVGGGDQAFAAALPVLLLMGATVVHQGGPGAGQHTKMANQIVIAGNMLGAAEGLAYAQAVGLDPAQVLYQIPESMTCEGLQAAGNLIEHGKPRGFAVPIALRTDFDALQLRAAAKRTKDGPQARRLLALAAICDGASRTEAAMIGGVTLQIVRDWVLKLNALGPEGLLDRKAPGQPPRLTDAHRAAVAAMIESGPTPAVHGVVRWRLVDLCQWLWDEHHVTVAKQTLSRELRAMNYRKLSARPRHHAQAEGAIDLFKRASQPVWTRSRVRRASTPLG